MRRTAKCTGSRPQGRSTMEPTLRPLVQSGGSASRLGEKRAKSSFLRLNKKVLSFTLSSKRSFKYGGAKIGESASRSDASSCGGNSARPKDSDGLGSRVPRRPGHG